MKKFLLLTVASFMTVFAMAMGDGTGSSKANSIEFDWENGHIHEASTLPIWYHVDLAPLYEEDSPALSLFLINPNATGKVNVTIHASVAGQEETRNYTIAAHKFKSFAEDAGLLVRLKQTEIFLTLKTDGTVKLSAKVFEASDLDETCKEAKDFDWEKGISQDKSLITWWRVPLEDAKAKSDKDVRIVITNKGSKVLDFKAGQSMDCPSSGTTRRSFKIAAGATVADTIPYDMIASVATDELYVGLENDQPIELKAEFIDRPKTPVIASQTPEILHVEDMKEIKAGEERLFAVLFSEMNSVKKHEPEFTIKNGGEAAANVVRMTAYKLPAFSAQTARFALQPGEENIEVIKKNMLEGLVGVDTMYLYVKADKDVVLFGRFKHVREGKACKTNIDFNWDGGHTQEARTTQWYAIDVTVAKEKKEDIIVHILNEGSESANLKASLAFSCPYIDVQEVSRTIGAGKEVSKKITYSTYAMMSDSIWAGLETSQDVRIWVTSEPTATKEADDLCLNAVLFDWENGAAQKANEVVWYKVMLKDVRENENFPTVYVRNQGANAATIDAELSLECPDVIENEKRTLKIAANDVYSKQISRNMFQNITADSIYLRVVSTEDIALELRFTEQAAGSACSSAIDFNWVIGNDQKADANLWYAVDLREAMKSDKDVEVKIQNKGSEACKASAWLAFDCADEDVQDVNFSLAARGAAGDTKTKVLPHSILETLVDSVVYVRVVGKTALHIEAKLVDPASFATIECEDIKNVTKLEWDKLYTQNGASAWYVISGEMLKQVADSAGITIQGYAKNTSAAKNTITAEIAYKCPIKATMISKSVALEAGAEVAKMIERNTVNLVANKDSVLLRLTANGAFQFKAEMVTSHTGNDRKHAIAIKDGERYEQAANTSVWYKLDSKAWKQNKNLFGKRLFVSAKNAGAGDAEVSAKVYDGLLSETDLVEYYLGSDVKRTIEKGKSESRDVPAQAVYALGDLEFYVQLHTTDSLMLESYYKEDYPTIAPDPDQQKAKMLVPNVEYTLPADTTMWFLVCAPYIQNNFKYIDDTKLKYELVGNDSVTVEVTGTFQDTMTYQMPVKKHTFNKSRKERKGEKTLREIADELIKRRYPKRGVPPMPEHDLDSMLHRFATSDSITGYVRVRADREIKLCLTTPQITGQDCANATRFDWEHGNVNAKDSATIYEVIIDASRVPDTTDLALHFENWSNDSVNVSATMYEDCPFASSTLGSASRKMAGGKDTVVIIEREKLETIGWGNFFIDYKSDQATHFWAELVPQIPRDTLRDTLAVQFVCPGTVFTDTVAVKGHTIDPNDPSTWQWNDTITNSDAKVVITFFTVKPLTAPKAVAMSEIAARPVIKAGAPIDVAAMDAELQAKFNSADSTVMKVATIEWLYSVDGSTFNALPFTPASEAVLLKYKATTECGDVLESDALINIVRDTVDVTACNSYKWDANDSTYILSTLDSVNYPLANGCDSLAYLNLTINNPLQVELKASQKYGNSLLMINRKDIVEKTGWTIDENAANGPTVNWYRLDSKTDNTPDLVGTGYYLTVKEGGPLPVGFYYAEIIIEDGECDKIGRTKLLDCTAAPAGAPALVPSIVRPDEIITVINLDPEQETVIRVYTTEGFMVNSTTVSGEQTAQFKAASENGYYLVELISNSVKSTLRYIVK